VTHNEIAAALRQVCRDYDIEPALFYADIFDIATRNATIRGSNAYVKTRSELEFISLPQFIAVTRRHFANPYR